MLIWAEWEDAVPGLVAIDLVGHEGGNNRGEFCLFPGYHRHCHRHDKNAVGQEQGPEMGLCRHQRRDRAFPILDIDSDNGEEFIIWELLTWCELPSRASRHDSSGWDSISSDPDNPCPNRMCCKHQTDGWMGRERCLFVGRLLTRTSRPEPVTATT